MSFRDSEKYMELLDKKDVICLCERCEDGSDRNLMDEIKLIHHESLMHIYDSEEAFIHEANYQCPECKLIMEYCYDNGHITISYDFEEWKFLDEWFELH